MNRNKKKYEKSIIEKTNKIYQKDFSKNILDKIDLNEKKKIKNWFINQTLIQINHKI